MADHNFKFNRQNGVSVSETIVEGEDPVYNVVFDSADLDVQVQIPYKLLLELAEGAADLLDAVWDRDDREGVDS